MTCEAVANSGSSSLVALSTSSTTGMPRAAAARQIGRTKSGKRLSTSSTSMSATSACRVRRRRAVEAAAVQRRHHLLAVAVDEDAGHRDRAALDASTPDGSTPVFASASRKRPARVVGADRPGEARASAEPRHRDRGIGGAAAGRGDQVARRASWCPARESCSTLNRKSSTAMPAHSTTGAPRGSVRSQRRSPPTARMM